LRASSLAHWSPLAIIKLPHGLQQPAAVDAATLPARCAAEQTADHRLLSCATPLLQASASKPAARPQRPQPPPQQQPSAQPSSQQKEQPLQLESHSLKVKPGSVVLGRVVNATPKGAKVLLLDGSEATA
jgi:hypothetical protein